MKRRRILCILNNIKLLRNMFLWDWWPFSDIRENEFLTLPVPAHIVLLTMFSQNFYYTVEFSVTISVSWVTFRSLSLQYIVGVHWSGVLVVEEVSIQKTRIRISLHWPVTQLEPTRPDPNCWPGVPVPSLRWRIYDLFFGAISSIGVPSKFGKGVNSMALFEILVYELEPWTHHQQF